MYTKLCGDTSISTALLTRNDLWALIFFRSSINRNFMKIILTIDVAYFVRDVGYKLGTIVDEGVKAFVEWY